MRYLGLDLGSRTLGIAVSETGLIASNYKTIRHEEEYDRLLDEVKALVDELKIDTVVLGFPKNMNNTIGPKGELSLEFKEKLEEKELTNKLNPIGIEQNKRISQIGGHTAKVAKEDVEKNLGKSIISNKNNLKYKHIDDKLIETKYMITIKYL